MAKSTGKLRDASGISAARVTASDCSVLPSSS
jgi:hypothetical protein